MSLEQSIVCLSKFAESLKPILPYARKPDALSLAHSRAAADVHWVGSWLLRGHDLSTLCTWTPFWLPDSSGLWQYYDSLQLSRCPEKIFLVLMVSECISRKDYPRLRRLIDLYTGAVAIASCFPQRFFYWLHRARWHHRYQEATFQYGVPPPLPALPDNMDSLVEGTKASIVKLLDVCATGSTKSRRPTSSSGWSWGTWLLVATSVGVAVVWAANPGSARQAKDLAVKKIQDLREQASGQVPSLKDWLTGGNQRSTAGRGQQLQLQLHANQ
mmetsp:Transcript_70551/g.131999  ORF Transcript_70551/g.131999 Transcript_70551/m.131999 type:complete len:271 (-) Transcript_70551:112-924(-)